MKFPIRPRAHQFSGFTLIEMLIVISIIVVLAGLAFPAVNGAIDSARKSQAKSTVTQIAAAVTAYETEYGKLPSGNATTVDLSFVQILAGLDNVENPRQIVFLEAPVWKKGKGGTNAQGYCDPWDEATPYSIALDDDYDNEIDVSTNGSATGSETIRKKVGVWNVNTTNRYQIRSWD
jgi:prepilin-type N-terminal cleavage/methylation domain-containing protein